VTREKSLVDRQRLLSQPTGPTRHPTPWLGSWQRGYGTPLAYPVLPTNSNIERIPTGLASLDGSRFTGKPAGRHSPAGHRPTQAPSAIPATQNTARNNPVHLSPRASPLGNRHCRAQASDRFSRNTTEDRYGPNRQEFGFAQIDRTIVGQTPSTRLPGGDIPVWVPGWVRPRIADEVRGGIKRVCSVW